MTSIHLSKLYIKKRTIPQWLVLFVLIMPFLLSCFLELLKLPGLVKYTVDVAWLGVFAYLFCRQKLKIRTPVIPFALLVGVWLVYTASVYLLRFQSPFYYLWGFRNNFRFYALFLGVAMLLTENDANDLLKLMDKLFWVNAAVSLVQFFFLGKQGDFLGGLFGVETGCNAYSIIFFSIICGKAMLSYMNGTEKALSCFLKCGAALLLSAMAEAKVFFLIFAMICVVAAIFTKFSWRKLLLILAAALLLTATSSVLTEIFGERSALSWERIVQLITTESYASKEDLSRFTALPTISRDILRSLPQKLFGLGLGNCDTSSFAICNTPFFHRYADLHYTWFSSAFLFLETGYFGLALFLLFFVLCFALALRMKKRGGNELFCQMSIIMSLICIVLTFYNSSLRVEVAYLAYFVLALPFIHRNKTT